jgi:hypothetical protein
MIRVRVPLRFRRRLCRRFGPFTTMTHTLHHQCMPVTQANAHTSRTRLGPSQSRQLGRRAGLGHGSRVRRRTLAAPVRRLVVVLLPPHSGIVGAIHLRRDAKSLAQLDKLHDRDDFLDNADSLRNHATSSSSQTSQTMSSRTRCQKQTRQTTYEHHRGRVYAGLERAGKVGDRGLHAYISSGKKNVS